LSVLVVEVLAVRVYLRQVVAVVAVAGLILRKQLLL
jgi:hypothetical protein